MSTTFDQAPARVLMDRPDADNYPPTRLPSRRSIGVMTRAGSWPIRSGDPKVATTSRIVWRSAQAVPGGGTVWDMMADGGTIPEWQPAKASGWFLFPWLRQLKQWTLDMEANARPLVIPWAPDAVEPGGTQPEHADNGCIIDLGERGFLTIQGLRPANASDVFLGNLRGGKIALGHYVCDGASLETPTSPPPRGSQGPKSKRDGLIGPDYLRRFIPSFEARLVGYPISYGPGASFVAPGWPEHPLPAWYFNTPAPFGPGPGPDRLPSFCGFALDITDAAIEAWLAHLRDTGRRKSVRYEEARRQFARNLRGWQTDADAPKAGTKRPTRVRLSESGSGRHGLESEGTLVPATAAAFALSDVVTEADGWELGDELLEFGAWVVTDGLPAAP